MSLTPIQWIVALPRVFPQILLHHQKPASRWRSSFFRDVTTCLVAENLIRVSSFGCESQSRNPDKKKFEDGPPEHVDLRFFFFFFFFWRAPLPTFFFFFFFCNSLFFFFFFFGRALPANFFFFFLVGNPAFFFICQKNTFIARTHCTGKLNTGE